MKGPKYSKFEDNKDEINNYNFFQVGLFPEKEKENSKKIKNRSSQKKNQRPSLSMPNDVDKNKIPNTQKDDDLLPFFAKDYPSSSESKEEICFINSPLPSNTYTGGEAEEIEGIEEEEANTEKNELIKDKINNNINNKEFDQSIDFNSELEAQMEEHSQIMGRDEVIERFTRMQNKRKKEEEKKIIKKENNIKEEEKKKIEKEEKEKLQKLIVEGIEKKAEDERNRIKEEENRKADKENRMKEEVKKLKLEKEKKKNENINLLSSIKKQTDDIAPSTSMIKEVNQIFPDVIQEEKGESGEEEDYSKKNYKHNSKNKYSKSSNKNKINEDNRKNNFFEKKVSNFDKNKKNFPEDNRNLVEEVKKRSSKTKKDVKSKKSNGIKAENKNKQNKLKFEGNDEDEEYSDYGDELQSSDSDQQKKTKVKVKEKIKSKPEKKLSFKQKFPNGKSDIIITLYGNIGEKIQTISFDPKNENEENNKGRKYSLRHRLPRLRHELGERVHYVDRGNGPEIDCIELASNNLYGFEEINSSSRFRNKIEDKQRKLRKKKKLKKGGILVDEHEEIEEKSNEDDDEENANNYNSGILDSQKFSEFGEEDTVFLKIKKGGKKNSAKNYNTKLLIKIHEANGKNIIKVDKTIYSNLKSGDTVKVNKNQIYEILNFSDNELIVQLLFDDDD